ncbi:MAG: hypothetical protein EA373_03140 [Oceanospirillales bacterium]|nr:MAG: hypothetical protein EA373_03140 [Oceanospirillales bacterium]
MEICLVGGAVRDQLLGLEVKDRDWVVIGATPDEMRQQGFRAVGKDFPVFINPDSGEEYALARTERKSGHGYQGFTFHTDPSVTLEEDLCRRDLTINAMAIRSDGTLVDPYQGQKDLKAKVLRHISAAFAEDPLRVLRVARFAARFHPLGFSIAPETLSLMQQISASGELEHLSAERVWSEFERSLHGEFPLVFLECLKESHALERLLAELQQIDWDNAKRILNRLNALEPTAEQRFALISQLAFQSASHQGKLDAFCQRLKAPKRFQQAASDLLQWHTILASFEQQTAENRWKLIKSLKLLRQPERLACLLAPTLALHPEAPEDLGQKLSALLERMGQVSSAYWAAQGVKGKALGEAMEQAYLELAEEL